MSNTEYIERRTATVNTALASIKDQIKMPPDMWEGLSAIINEKVCGAIDQHLKPIIGTNSSFSSSSTTTSRGSDIGTGGGGSTRKSGRILAWNEWKADPDNDDKKKYKDSNGVDQTAFKWWGENVWKSMDDDKKKIYNDQAKQMNDEANKNKTAASSSGGAAKGKRGTSKTAFWLFQECNKLYYSKEEKFTDPSNNASCTGYEISRKIWSNKIKDDKDVSKPFNELSDRIKKGEVDYDSDLLKKLPHLDWDDMKSNGLSSYDDYSLVD